MESINIFGVRIDNISMDDAVKVLEDYLKGDRLNTIYTPNTEIVMKAKEDENIRGIINSGDLVTPDGIGLIYGSRIRKKPLKERVTGFDLSINLLEMANENGYSLFLLGGKDGVAKKAGENIKKDYPNIRIVGHHHGYFEGSHRGVYDSQEERTIIHSINKVEPDIIFVGLGFPGQEIWIYNNRDRLRSKVIIGNGGTLDILAGNMKRAPEIFQRLGLEWFYRLLREPSRIKRQIALPKFILSVLFTKDVVD
ncbi:MAG: WecB/TagA/CpsF family glycosyltransferase [Tissierellia bacterium]|nr:WecB/TagA/CpsF family glycosyltransferase [Tissierellia bacterium]